MNYLKAALSVLGAVFLAEFLPALWWMLRNTNGEKATGLAVIPGGFVESLLSPLFWVLAALFFFLFRWASKSQHISVRALLFWMPTVLFLAIGILLGAFVGYAFLHIRRS